MRVRDDILKHVQSILRKSIVELGEYLQKHAYVGYEKAKGNKAVLLSYLPEDQYTNFTKMHNFQKQSQDQYDLLIWYLNRVLQLADSVDTVKQCVPEYYHKHLVTLECNGSREASELLVADCYNILEGAVLTTVILGINNDT